MKLPELGAERVSLRARWVFSGCGPPLENGTVEITAGRISAIHGRLDRPTSDLGNVAVIPGLVNAHTHLELSDLAAPLPPARPFTAWLKAVMNHRRDRAANGAADDEAVSAGVWESARNGTATIGDIAGRPTSRPSACTHRAQRTVAFLEILGLTPERIQPQLQRAREYLAGDGALCGAGVPPAAVPSERPHHNTGSSRHEHPASDVTVIRGISPHAPYSVHPDLLRGLIDLAVKHRAPLAMHLAETRSELELLATGSGEFIQFLQELGVWRDDAIPRGSRPLDYLRDLARVERALVIHGNYLDDEEIGFVGDHPNISVVYCPRTHAYFQHAPHPWRKLLSRGVNLALGTDSRASNPDLSLFGEMLFLRQLAPDFGPAQLLRLGTQNGALALGVDDETGRLVVGKSADLAIIALPDSDRSDPYSLLFDPASRVAGLQLAERGASVNCG